MTALALAGLAAALGYLAGRRRRAVAGPRQAHRIGQLGAGARVAICTCGHGRGDHWIVRGPAPVPGRRQCMRCGCLAYQAHGSIDIAPHE